MKYREMPCANFCKNSTEPLGKVMGFNTFAAAGRPERLFCMKLPLPPNLESSKA